MQKYSQTILDRELRQLIMPKLNRLEFDEFNKLLNLYTHEIFNSGYNHCAALYDVCNGCGEDDKENCSKDPVNNECPRIKKG